MSVLLVPIALDVLVVRGQTAKEDWSVTAVNPPKPQLSGHRRHQLIPDPFQTLPAPRLPGAYLHWALPDALTHAAPVGGSTGFPALPNRWLVVRVSGPAAPGSRAVDAWLLPDSGAQSPVHVAHALTGPALPAAGPAPVAPLTALGHGDLAWAAYFDNVVDRFALYDDLTGATGPLAYLVCGWYVDAAQDPMAATSESDFHDRLSRMRWDLQSELGSGTPYPTNSVYHAAALSIGWPNASWPGDGGSLGAELDLRPDPAKVQISIGETLAEAVAALAPAAVDRAVARLLEATIAGTLGDIATADGPATLDTALHVSRFGSTPSKSKTEYIWEPAPEAASSAGASANTGAFRAVKRTLPRVWHALDPSLVVRGGGRSAKHGGDGRYTANGHLVCRVNGTTVTAFGVDGGNRGRGADVLPSAPLSSLPVAYGVPAVAADLLVELASLDPGSAPDLASASATQTSPVAAARARWWSAFDPASSASDALTGAHVEGALPSPVGVTPPARPWTPLHIEWKASYLPSPRGAHDWELADADFELPTAVARPDVDPNHPLAGRAMLSGTPATLLQAATSGTGAAGGDLGVEDLLSGTITDIAAQLRGDSTAADIHKKGATDPKPDKTRPANFVALRAGFLKIEQLRLVDGFGQHVDTTNVTAGSAITVGATLSVPQQPDLAVLRPRFTAPARVLFRFADANGDPVEAGGGVSPVCGFLVASPLDGTLEFFDADGNGVGRLRPDIALGTTWEADPGQTSLVGARPSSVLHNRFLGQIVDRLLAADVSSVGVEKLRKMTPTVTALRSLVAVLDTTKWSVDITGRAGDEHLSLLLGHPIAVIRAAIKIEVQDPREPPENDTTGVPVKLGTLAHQQDGLLAYFVADDFDRVYIVDPAVTDLAAAVGHGPIDSLYVDPTGTFFVNPGLSVPITLLMVPGSDVHVTTGLLPQKAVGLLRDWTAPALTRLSPALRFGPLLRDGDATRLPVSADIRGNWLWHRREDPATWATDAVVPATVSALLPDNPVTASDGWLQVQLLPDSTYTQHAVQVEITCAQKRGSQIIALGGLNPNGSHFLLPVAQVVQMQESGRFAFFVDRIPGKPPVFTKIVHAGNVKYLRTTADSKSPNNLSKLPKPPAAWL
jgi:Protein of unknown function (DUF3892)